jgi:hypothetical protein
MIWTFIYWNGRGNLVFVRGGMYKHLYKNILKESVLPHCLEMLDQNGMSQIYIFVP